MESEATAATEVCCSWDFPTDVFVEILLRLPTRSRRRFRLVCRLWRDVVDKCMPEIHQRRPKPLITSTYIVDDISSSTSSLRNFWPNDGTLERQSIVVGTCNGLLCLCDDHGTPGGAITLANPATRETLPVPPLPFAGLFAGSRYAGVHWHEAYDFAYNQTTGVYKIVHVPCRFGQVCDFGNLRVLTLGEASWRELPTPGDARCKLEAGIVSVQDTTCWVTEDTHKNRIMSFDLGGEHVRQIAPVPMPAGSECHLADVRGRLGAVITSSKGKTEVWVLEGGSWNRRYNVGTRRPAWPHFVYGQYILTLGFEQGLVYCRQKLDDTWRLKGLSDLVQISARAEKVAALGGWYESACHRTFAYVETTEPLGVYRI